MLSGCAGKKPAGSAPPPGGTPVPATPTPTPRPIKDPEGGTVSARFNPPPGYARTPLEDNSFGAYLRSLPLKADGEPVLLMDGTERPDAPQAAVLSISMCNKNQQGPRALVRLRAEYLFQTGQAGRITYHFFSEFVFPFTKWCEGYRVNVDGRNVEWEKKAGPSGDHDALLSYLNILFAYSNAASLKKELQPATDMQPGDVFINDKSVMIADMAVNTAGETVFLLLQSPAPTQEIYILKNDNNPALSPWYSASELSPLVTPEGEFTLADLGRFDEQVNSE